MFHKLGVTLHCLLGACPVFAAGTGREMGRLYNHCMDWIVDWIVHWITGLTFELKLCVSHDLHPIKCAELGHMFDA